MSKKIFSFIPYFWSPHIETELELIHGHLEQGDEVTVFICNGELPVCYSNLTHDEHVCGLCSNRRRNAFGLLNLWERVSIRNFINLTPSDMEILKRYQGIKVETQEELLKLKLDECPLGTVIYNELSSVRQDDEPNIPDESEYIEKSIESYVMIYLSFKNHFAELSPDFFYTFNGRLVAAHAAVEAARVHNVEFGVHDRAAATNRYRLVKNDSLNSLSYWKNHIETHWANSEMTEDEKKKFGIEWFEARQRNETQGWFSFTSEQDIDLPKSFDKARTNLVIFNSSDFEMIGIDEFQPPFYENQRDGLLKLATDLERVKDLQIYLRVHPHLKDKNNAQTRFITEQLTGRFKNFEVIEADSKIRTYSLLRHADAILTFGSTVGIEAAFIGIPSLLAGRAFYEGVGACTSFSTHQDLLNFIVDGTFRLSEVERTQRRDAALKYGYFCQTGGTPYKLFKQTGVFEMKIGDSEISYDPPTYEDGLKLELSRKAELRALPNPFNRTITEMETLILKYKRESQELRRHLNAAKAKLEKATNGSTP